MKSKMRFIGFITFLFCCFITRAQEQVIKGRVKDDKSPLPGVSVLVKGSQAGTLTDVNGNFNISAPKGSTLVISSTGYAPQEIIVRNQTDITITLVSDAKALEGIVVIGYGTKRKQNLTGAVSTVSPEVFQARPTTDVLTALQGEVPGVVIQR